jgi:hypothetical protein
MASKETKLLAGPWKELRCGYELKKLAGSGRELRDR